MARMKTGRLTPKTTDPKTGARVADPDVYGKKVEEGTVGSWPEARKIYQQAKAAGRNLNQDYHPDVKKYLEGETNQLSDKEFEEPIMMKTHDDYGVKRDDFYTNFKKGGKNYNRMEARTKSNLGKFYEPYKEGQMGQYHSAQTESNINKSGSFAGHYTTDLDQYRKKPVKAEFTKPTPTKPSVPEDLTLPGKMDIRKAGPIKGNTKLAKGKPAKVVEKADFINPGKSVNRVKVKTGAALTHGKGGGLVKDVFANKGTREAGLKAARVVKDTKNIYNKGYNKEERRFKAYAGTTATGDSFQGMLPGEIRNYREKAKSARAEYRKQPDSEVKAMGKAAMTSEIRQSRKAEKFAKAGLKSGGIKHFTDKNYGGPIMRDYRESTQNAANRNTMESKIKSAGAKAKSRVASFGNMPTS